MIDLKYDESFFFSHQRNIRCFMLIRSAWLRNGSITRENQIKLQNMESFNFKFSCITTLKSDIKSLCLAVPGYLCVQTKMQAY